MKPKEKYNKKLLVEGNDDQHVVWALCEKFEIPENFDVIDCGGISNLLLQIPLRLKQADINTIGIIIDADINLKEQWNKLVRLLSTVGFDCPAVLPPNGLILQKDNVKLGVWIMPNNNLNGMLEDFIAFLIPNEDELSGVVHDTLGSIETKGINKYQAIHKPKAYIHSWLSWQETPGTPMGLAITKKYLNTEDDNCAQFINWITNLYE
jgi:hypothetical protein